MKLRNYVRYDIYNYNLIFNNMAKTKINKKNMEEPKEINELPELVIKDNTPEDTTVKMEDEETPLTVTEESEEIDEQSEEVNPSLKEEEEETSFPDDIQEGVTDKDDINTVEKNAVFGSNWMSHGITC